MEKFILLFFHSVTSFRRHLTSLGIVLFVIFALLLVTLIIVADKKELRPWTPDEDEIMYWCLSLTANALIYYHGYTVNSYAFDNIFQIPGRLTVDYGVYVGMIALLIMSMISVITNIKLYRRWYPDGSYKSTKFLIPLCAYILIDVLYPLYRVYTW